MEFGHHHYAISVPNLDESIAWYQQMLGFRLLGRHEIGHADVAMMSHGEARLEIFAVPRSHSLPESERNPGEALSVQGLKHIALEVDDVRAAYHQLQAKGVQFAIEPKEFIPGIEVAFFWDNAGITYELYPKGR